MKKFKSFSKDLDRINKELDDIKSEIIKSITDFFKLYKINVIVCNIGDLETDGFEIDVTEIDKDDNISVSINLAGKYSGRRKLNDLNVKIVNRINDLLYDMKLDDIVELAVISGDVNCVKYLLKKYKSEINWKDWYLSTLCEILGDEIENSIDDEFLELLIQNNPFNIKYIKNEEDLVLSKEFKDKYHDLDLGSELGTI